MEGKGVRKSPLVSGWDTQAQADAPQFCEEARHTFLRVSERDKFQTHSSSDSSNSLKMS